MNTVEVLKKAKERISTPDRWYQGGYTERLGTDDQVPRDDEPCCIIGALYWATNSTRGSSTQGFSQLSYAAPGFLPTFNDDPDTTHSEIMAVFDIAIAIAAAEAGQ